MHVYFMLDCRHMFKRHVSCVSTWVFSSLQFSYNSPFAGFFLHTHSYIMIFFKCIFWKARYSVFVSMTNRSNLSARLKSKTKMSSTYHVDWCYIKLQFVWIQLLARNVSIQTTTFDSHSVLKFEMCYSSSLFSIHFYKNELFLSLHEKYYIFFCCCCCVFTVIPIKVH